jgi:hypothetical protein
MWLLHVSEKLERLEISALLPDGFLHKFFSTGSHAERTRARPQCCTFPGEYCPRFIREHTDVPDSMTDHQAF